MATQLFLLIFAAGTFLFGATAQSAETGQAAPNCRLAALDGQQSHDLQKYRGKVVYVDFWASWCSPCGQSFPFMTQLSREFGNRGLQVVAINVDEDREEAKAFLAKHPAGFAVAADESGKCPIDFGVRAMPSSYLIDRQGVIRHVHLGFRPGEAEKTRALLEQLLAEPARQ